MFVYLEIFGRYCDSGLSTKARKFGTFGHLKAEDVQQRREEKEELSAGQSVAQAHPASDAERNEVFRLDHLTFSVEESLRIEHLRILPQGRIHVDGVD